MKVGVSGHFDAAHRLMKHGGKCSNLHGHRYVVEVFLFADINSSTGMAIDFSVLKKCLKEVTDFFDHKTILNEKDVALGTALEKHACPVVFMPGEPTAENMCSTFLKALQDSLEKLWPSSCWHIGVRVYETPTNYAESLS
jgi:6-pyruvoyltetrahydropterin/6-carboxytetrahydropterin synthase